MELKRVTREIIDHAEKTMIPDRSLPRAVDDYLINLLKRDEMDHAEVDSRMYEAVRQVVQARVLPIYEEYRRQTARVRERKLNRKLWHYVLGTAGSIGLLEAILTRGRFMAPQVFIPSVLLLSFLGFIIYTAAQYVDDLQLRRARKRLEESLDSIETTAVVDAEYDNRRQLRDADVLRAEALEVLARYTDPEDFWRDYFKVRSADPTLPAELRALNAPAFAGFLKYHIEGQQSAAARQHRFNRLFIEAQEVFISRDRDKYVLDHLKTRSLPQSSSSSLP